jgi:hypothetical protein
MSGRRKEIGLDHISESAIILELDVTFSTLSYDSSIYSNYDKITNLGHLSKMDASKMSNLNSTVRDLAMCGMI